MSLYLSKKQLELLGVEPDTLDEIHAKIYGPNKGKIVINLHMGALVQDAALRIVLDPMSNFFCSVTLGIDSYSQTDFILAGPDINCCNALKNVLKDLEKEDKEK